MQKLRAEPTENESAPLVCPACRTLLRRIPRPGDEGTASAWCCEPCAKRYPVRDGVVCFLEVPDSFYEGLFTGTISEERPETLAGRVLGRLRMARALDTHYAALLRRHLGPEHARILDLGCGGGNRELLRRGAKVTGVDLSFASLRNAAGVYACAARASAARLPFPDGCFDAVVSSNFLGHVAFDEKDAVYGEMRRVLKSGGLMLHQLETSSLGAVFRFARRDPDFYRRQIVEIDGHVGIELPSRALQRFRDHGFEIVRVRRDFVWYFFPYGEAIKRFDNDFSRRNVWLRLLARADRFLENRPRLQKVWNLAMGLVNDPICRIAPIDRTIGLSLALRKPPRAESRAP